MDLKQNVEKSSEITAIISFEMLCMIFVEVINTMQWNFTIRIIKVDI